MTIGKEAKILFKEFRTSTDIREIRSTFNQFCHSLNVDYNDHANIYKNIKSKFSLEDSNGLWTYIDKRAQQKVYMKGRACQGKSALIIGGGLCGLRTAIECRLLGMRVVVVEMRDYISRNNVLHLWPLVIHDLKTLGAKIFYPKFCTGSLDHISIRRLQTILLKISLVLGAQVFCPVEYLGLVEPCEENGIERRWRGKFLPADHPVHGFEFDVIVGADGKRDTLEGFNRKCFRGRQAIGITANFVNYKTREDNRAEEIGGLFYVFNQPFFQSIKDTCNMDLENFVYYKNETHYIVMTAKKQCLLEQGILKENYPIEESRKLLSPENINRERLLECTKVTVDFATRNQLPNLDYCINHRDQEDVAIFDFTAMQTANYTCHAKERRGHKLLLSIVGDSVIEPFWPTGSGAARGFLTAWDAAWAIRSWCQKKNTPLQVIAERESVFKMLSQTTPHTLSIQFNKYTIDPITRYGTRLKLDTVKPQEVRHLYDTGGTTPVPMVMEPDPEPAKIYSRKRQHRSNSVDGGQLVAWFQERLNMFSDIFRVTDLRSSWYSGQALCGLVEVYRPGSIDVRQLDPSDVMNNNRKAFSQITEQFGIAPLMSPADMTSEGGPDALALISYLSQLHAYLEPLSMPSYKPADETDTAHSDDDNDDDEPFSMPPVKRRPSAMGLLELMTSRMDGNRTPMGSLTPMSECDERAPLSSLDACQGIASKRISGIEDKFQNEAPKHTSTEANSWVSFSAPNGYKEDESDSNLYQKPYSSPLLRKKNITDNSSDNGSASSSPVLEKKQTVAESGNEGSPSASPLLRKYLPHNGGSAQSSPSHSPVMRRKKRQEDGGERTREEKNEQRKSVLELRQQLENKIQRNSDQAKQQIWSSSGTSSSHLSQACAVCSKAMYVVEKHTAHGFFFHRHCFRCDVCKCLLRITTSYPVSYQDNRVKFLCFTHAYQDGQFTARWTQPEAIIYKSDEATNISGRAMRQNKLDWMLQNAITPTASPDEQEPMSIITIDDTANENIHDADNRNENDLDDKETSDIEDTGVENDDAVVRFEAPGETATEEENNISDFGDGPMMSHHRSVHTQTTFHAHIDDDALNDSFDDIVSYNLSIIKQTPHRLYSKYSARDRPEDGKYTDNEIAGERTDGEVNSDDNFAGKRTDGEVNSDDGIAGKRTDDEVNSDDDIDGERTDGRGSDDDIDGKRGDDGESSEDTEEEEDLSEERTSSPTSSSTESEPLSGPDTNGSDSEERMGHHEKDTSQTSDDEIVASKILMRRKRRNASESARSLYRFSRSMRLMMAFEIQRGLEEVENEEQELEERGLEVEKKLRDPGPDSPKADELMDEWLDVLHKKNQLRNKESKLELKMKLVELQDKHKLMCRKLQAGNEGPSEERKKIEADALALEEEMFQIKTQMSELHIYLKDEGAVM